MSKHRTKKEVKVVIFLFDISISHHFSSNSVCVAPLSYFIEENNNRSSNTDDSARRSAQNTPLERGVSLPHWPPASCSSVSPTGTTRGEGQVPSAHLCFTGSQPNLGRPARSLTDRRLGCCLPNSPRWPLNLLMAYYMPQPARGLLHRREKG